MFFDSYEFYSEHSNVDLEISLSTLIETMNIYGTASNQPDFNTNQDNLSSPSSGTHLQLEYVGYGHPLVLKLYVYLYFT